MENNNQSKSKIIIIALAVILLITLGYAIYQSGEHKEVTDAIAEEKAEIELNLDTMIVKYEDAIADQTSLSNELELERDKIVALRDSIKGLKSTNYGLIRRYRKQIEALEAANLELFQINEELTLENQSLSKNLDSVNVRVLNQIAKNDTLALKNIDLSEKVAIGSILKVNSAKALAMRQRNSGKLVETSRSRNTDAFRINFNISKNEIADRGERNVYIQIVDSKGTVLGNAGELVLLDETTIAYSDRTLVDYLNEDIAIISLVEVDRESIAAGIYTVNVYIDGVFSGASTVTLK